jgi:pentatricopeptide repeat-containing protein PET309
MLERASSCVEPAAQNLFRSIEAPTRSQRRLPQTFWRHARFARECISWWPEYLKDIRQAAQAREGGDQSSTPAQRVGPGQLDFLPKQRSLADSATTSLRQGVTSITRRHISKVVKQSRLRDEKRFEEALEPEDKGTPPPEVALFAPEGIPRPRKPRVEITTGKRLEELLRAGGDPKYNAVWLAFISLEEQGTYARAVLRYLSQASLPIVLKRALRTFQMIEVEDRTHLTYESAVRAAVGLRKYAAANEYVLEALERGLGIESSQYLMAHLIENEMWKSAVQALHVFMENSKFEPDHQNITNQHVWQHMLQAPVWRTVDGMLSLPQTLLGLSRRLKENDAVLASDRADINYLATCLLERALRSTTIMGVITSKGVLSLFDNFRELGLLRLQHYLDALSALRALRDSRNRSQLALLIFRNMRSVYPKCQFHDSTYGTMISILSAAPNEPKAFEHVLRDVNFGINSVSGRKCDLAMYQRVMSACAKQGHTTYVEDLLQRLVHDHGIPKDLAYFTPVLLSYAKRADVHGAKRFFDRLSSRYGLQPSQQCWNILLLAFARADDVEGAAALFRQMGSLGIIADAYTFGTLMSLCSNVGDTRALLQLVDMAKTQKIPASTAMIDTIVHSYCLNEELKEAESLVEAATQMNLSDSPVRMWNILLRHYAFRADSGAVLRTQERMRELAVKPDGMTYAALMTYLVIVGKTKNAASILRSLHLGQVVTASRFHYSIVFHGYVQEGQRDQAIVIYAEMLKRFRRPSPSAHLAMVHLQSQRDDLRAQRQEAEGAANWDGGIPRPASPLQSHSIDYLADALLEMAHAESVSDEPQPGFRRRNPITAAAGLYLEVPFAILSRLSSYEKAEKLARRYHAAIKASPMSKQQKSHKTVQLLTAQLRGLVKSYEGSGRSTMHLQKQSFRRLDAIWSQISTQTMSSAMEWSPGLLDHSLSDALQEISSAEGSIHLAQGAVAGLDAVPEPDTIIGREGEVSPTKEIARIIPARRYALSVPLSAYMRGLALQNRWSRLESLLDSLENLGFELTGKNWNTYIQLLSGKRATVLKAFRIFEQKMLPNTPPWELLKRGKVLLSTLDESLPTRDDKSEAVKRMYSRTIIEKRDPGRLTPTYFTVIHLAAAFIQSYRAQSTGIEGENMSLYNQLRSKAPGTVKFIQAMPLLKDRVQGVLLRTRAVKGDLTKKPRESQLVDRAGLLGGRSLLQDVLSEEIEMLEISKKTKELESVLEEIQHPVAQEALSSARLPVSQDIEGQTQFTQHQQTKQSSSTELQERETPMIATEAGGDPIVDGLPPAAPGTFNRATKKSKKRIKFEKRVAALRKMAEDPEPRNKPWSLRSVRRGQQNLRITVYPANPSNKQLKPQGYYRHKSPLFTKPLLTMRVLKRRELGSERRAFDKSKRYLDLKREREREVRKAQARVRRMRRVQAQQQNIGVDGVDRGGGRLEYQAEDVGVDDGDFLEMHRVDTAWEKPDWRTREDVKLGETPTPRPPSTATELDEAEPQPESSFAPWGQMDMFDEGDFVGSSQQSQEGQEGKR